MTQVRLNAYRIMWMFVMFDLPTATKSERKAYAIFRKNLEKDGFIMHQFSVYKRFCASIESVEVHIKRIRSFVPSKGKVSIFTITDKQYSNVVNIWGAIEQKSKPQPMQLEFF